MFCVNQNSRPFSSDPPLQEDDESGPDLGGATSGGINDENPPKLQQAQLDAGGRGENEFVHDKGGAPSVPPSGEKVH